MNWLMTVALVALAALPHQAGAFTWSNLAGLPGGQGNVTGTGAAARYAYPVACALDSTNNIYSVDNTAKVRKTTAAGVVTIFSDLASVGTIPGQTVSNAYAELASITCDTATNNFYAVDRNLHVIWRITSAGVASIFVGAPPTVSGYGAGGFLDGAPTGALFNSPQGIVFNASTLFVADTENQVIRYITLVLGTANTVGTLAGNVGVASFFDGTGTGAYFSHPTGITAAPGSVLVVVDTANYTLRQIASGGVVTTIAGQVGNNGMVDGLPAVSQFNFTWAGSNQISIDPAGTSVYVADGGNNNVRKVLISTGLVSTWLGSTTGLAGSVDGVANVPRFNNPLGIAFSTSAAGFAYVMDGSNSTLRKVVVSSRTVSTLAGTAPHPGFVNGATTVARFFAPNGIAVGSSGISYILDNNGIRKMTAAGAVTTLIPITDPFFAYPSPHAFPGAITVDLSGNIIAASPSEIYSITPAGVPTVLATGFSWAYSITTYPGVIVVYDLGTNTMYKSTSGGAFLPLTISGVSIVGSATITSQNSGGPIYLATGGKLYSFSATGPATATFIAGGAAYGDGTGAAAGFGNYLGANGIAVNGGIVYWADNASSTIRQITAAGVVTTIGGSLHLWGGLAGAGTASRFGAPCGIAVSTGGILYTTDFSLNGSLDQATGNNHNIWKGL